MPAIINEEQEVNTCYVMFFLVLDVLGQITASCKFLFVCLLSCLCDFRGLMVINN